jgi:hypothetical protein
MSSNKKGRILSGILPMLLCSQKELKTNFCGTYCPEVAVLAEAVPADFVTLR